MLSKAQGGSTKPAASSSDQDTGARSSNQGPQHTAANVYLPVLAAEVPAGTFGNMMRENKEEYRRKQATASSDQDTGAHSSNQEPQHTAAGVYPPGHTFPTMPPPGHTFPTLAPEDLIASIETKTEQEHSLACMRQQKVKLEVPTEDAEVGDVDTEEAEVGDEGEDAQARAESEQARAEAEQARAEYAKMLEVQRLKVKFARKD